MVRQQIGYPFVPFEPSGLRAAGFVRAGVARSTVVVVLLSLVVFNFGRPPGWRSGVWIARVNIQTPAACFLVPGRLPVIQSPDLRVAIVEVEVLRLSTRLFLFPPVQQRHTNICIGESPLGASRSRAMAAFRSQGMIYVIEGIAPDQFHCQFSTFRDRDRVNRWNELER